MVVLLLAGVGLYLPPAYAFIDWLKAHASVFISGNLK